MSQADLQYFLMPTTETVTSVGHAGGDAVFEASESARPARPDATRWLGGRTAALASVLISSALAVVLLTDADALLWSASTAVFALIAFHLVAVPRLRLNTELRFVRRSAIRAGALVFAATLTGLLDLVEARQILVVAIVAGSTLLAVALLPTWRSPSRNVLLVGDRKAAADLINQWRGQRGINIGGICLANEKDARMLDQVSGVTVHGSVASVGRIVLEQNIDQVVVAPGPFVSAYDVRRLSWVLENTAVDLAVAAEVHGATPHRIAPELIGRRLVLSVQSSQPSAVNRLLKGAVDRAAGAVLLLIFAIPMAVLALMIRLDSPGRAFFRQERTGRYGTVFTMYKMRTMSTDAEERLSDLRGQNEGAGPLFKLSDDPRVTNLGRVLRRTSLDELPQLINVVRGQMSLIGPRPGLPSEVSEYDDWIRRRLQVKPGMTGLWQVSGRSNLGWNESVRLDLDYVDNWTLRGDLAIAARTARAVAARDGAV